MPYLQKRAQTIIKYRLQIIRGISRDSIKREDQLQKAPFFNLLALHVGAIKQAERNTIETCVRAIEIQAGKQDIQNGNKLNQLKLKPLDPFDWYRSSLPLASCNRASKLSSCVTQDCFEAHSNTARTSSFASCSLSGTLSAM